MDSHSSISFQLPHATKKVGLAIGWKCNARCRMCCFSSGPDKEGSISLEIAKDCINQIAEMDRGIVVCFTGGGESFLHFSLLLELIRYSTSLRLRTEVVTNAFWAYSLKAAEEKLKRLKEAGLHLINISIDKFHQEFVPIQWVRNAIDAAKSLGIEIILGSVITKGDGMEQNKRKVGSY